MHLFNKMVLPNIALITCLGPKLGVFLLISAYIIAVARSL